MLDKILYSTLGALVAIAGAFHIANGYVEDLAEDLETQAATVTHAHAVISPCGIMQIVTTFGDGRVVLYNMQNPAPPEMIQIFEDLGDEKRSQTNVLCPTGVSNGQNGNRYNPGGVAGNNSTTA